MLNNKKTKKLVDLSFSIPGIVPKSGKGHVLSPSNANLEPECKLRKMHMPYIKLGFT